MEDVKNLQQNEQNNIQTINQATRQTTQFSNPDIPVLPSITQLPDPEQFEGARVEIEGWEVVEVKTFFDPHTGERLSEPVMTPCLKVFTKPLAYGKNRDGEEFPIRATALFNLKRDKNGRLGLSGHPNSNIQKFFRKLKVNSLQEIKGRYVTVTCTPEGWLRIVY